jgi:hypothetical protein
MSAMVATDRRLPGITFLQRPRPAAQGLPALDVAAFVGFAERGPLDLPVPVDDLNTYRAIFGDELPLAREGGAGTVYANLPRSVAAFFANGGRRCYVVRVAGAAARASRLRVPGLVALGAGGGAALAAIGAASPGRWSSRLRLAARLRITPLPASACAIAGELTLRLRVTGTPGTIQDGDLLRLALPDGRCWLFPVAAVSPPIAGESALTARQVWQLPGPDDLPLPAPVERVWRLTLDGAAPLDLSGIVWADSPSITLALQGGDIAVPGRGDLLLLRLAGGAEWLFPVRDANRGLASPPAPLAMLTTDRALLLTPPGGEELPALPLDSPLAVPRYVELLRCDLLPRDGDERRPPLEDAAFNRAHPRFWGEVALLESSALRRRAGGDEQARQGSGPCATTAAARAAQIYRDLQQERRTELDLGETPDLVALAGLLAPTSDDAALTYLPLGMPAVVDETSFSGPDSGEIGDDDLGVFSAAPFLDPYLAGGPARVATSPSALLTTAFDRYYRQDIRLKGLHSLVFVDEVALIAVPDAVQRGWQPTEPAAAPSFAPPAEPAPADEPCPPPGPFAACRQAPSIAGVEPPHGPVAGGTLVTIHGTGLLPGAAVYFAGSGASDVTVVSDTLLQCATPVGGLAGPVDVAVATANGIGIKPRAFAYEQAPTLPPLPAQSSPDDFALTSADGTAGALLTIQRALLTLCQARADVVGILTLPQHFETRHCVEWQEALGGLLGVPVGGRFADGANEGADLSYAAIYHPWTLVADASTPGQLRATPCDGAVCGAIAAREHDRGAWVAPANLPLRGVLGLVPALATDDWADLFARGFNLVRPEPRDFRPMSAHTLAGERALLQLSVRRLLILLRKAAVERGMDFVFASNHEQFREGARVMLEDLLRSLFDRGAFAGPTPQTSYRVVTDASVNTPQSVELGRFITQIQVAPSQPLEFMTVLLTRTGEGLLQTTEV